MNYIYFYNLKSCTTWDGPRFYMKYNLFLKFTNICDNIETNHPYSIIINKCDGALVFISNIADMISIKKEVKYKKQ